MPKILTIMDSIVDKIAWLQSQSSILDPEPETWEKSIRQWIPYMLEIIRQNQTGKAFSQYAPGSEYRPLPIRSTGRPVSEIINDLDQLLSPGLNPASGGHLAYIPGGGIPLGAIGDLLAALNNRYVGVNSVCPGGVEIENSLIAWMAEMLGFNTDNAGGSLTSGGSIANLTAVVAARDAMGCSPAEFPKLAVYLTTETHHCVHKALRIAAMDPRPAEQGGQVWYVETDKEYRMNLKHLENAIQQSIDAGYRPWLIVGTAGSTNTGAVDPLFDMSSIARQYKIWFHVDAAYGSFFMLTRSGRDLFRGIEHADSVVLDPHKTLFLSYGTGAVVLQNKNHLLRSFHYQADYLPAEEYAQSNISPELTKHFRSLRMWLALQYYGTQPFIAALNEKMLLAQYAADVINTLPGIEMITYPSLSVFAFRIKSVQHRANGKSSDILNKELIDEVKADGQVFISGTSIEHQGQHKFVLRLAIVSFRTHKEHIDHFLGLLKTYLARMH